MHITTSILQYGWNSLEVLVGFWANNKATMCTQLYASWWSCGTNNAQRTVEVGPIWFPPIWFPQTFALGLPLKLILPCLSKLWNMVQPANGAQPLQQ